jgi:hypothetical protein
VKAAYLIDPVDNTRFTPESSDYPSAVKALLHSGKQVGISGAGIVGCCNPKGSNFQVSAYLEFLLCFLTLVRYNPNLPARMGRGASLKCRQQDIHTMSPRDCACKVVGRLEEIRALKVSLPVQEFYGAVANGSWLTTVEHSSHTEFLNAGPILNRAIAALCGTTGHNSYQVRSQEGLIFGRVVVISPWQIV